MEPLGKAKAFFEVFPTVRVDQNLSMLFGEVLVEKVTTTSLRDVIRVHMKSTHLIQKKEIFQMEKHLKDQLFGRMQVQVLLVEKYELSKQYTPKALLHEYRESMLLELSADSALTAAMFGRANLRCSGENTVCLELAQSIVSEGKREFLQQYLEKLFGERFQRPVEIQIGYREESDVKVEHQEEEKRIQREINAIFHRTGSTQTKEERPEQAAEANETSKATKEAKAGKVASTEPRKKPAAKGEFIKREARPVKYSDDPSLIYGRYFEDEPIKLNQVQTEMGEITVQGKIIAFDTREIRNEKSILMFAITDFTDTIMVKMFARNEQLPELLTHLQKGNFVRVKGITMIDKYDAELTIGSVTGIRKATDFTTKRQDLSLKKRVELHCHTKMSDMDGVSDVKTIVGRAHDWGHPAIAITDHGVAQSFPDANHYMERLSADDPFQVIYGIEGYIVDDMTEIAVGATSERLDETYVVFDLETTGFSALKDRIIEIGAVKVSGGKIVDRFSTFVNPKRPIPFEITQLTGISDEMVMDSATIEEILPQFLGFLGDGILVAHNAGFDVGFIEENAKRLQLRTQFVYVDTVGMARVLLPTVTRYKLNYVAKLLGITLANHHRAVDDAQATAEIFIKFTQMLAEREIYTLDALNTFGKMNPNAIRKLPTYHIILLVQNDIGRYHLYQMISKSHLEYFARRPRIPKSLLMEHREGIIVGSACEAGELYHAMVEGKSPETIAQLAQFYDYYEIQPTGNNQFMIGNERYPEIQSAEDLQEINRKIVQLGEQFQKPVVATCDVHFLDPDDEVYRRIIMAGKGFQDADSQPPLYLRTTEEMLEEFQYLGANKAREVVIDNTNKIANMIEKISPVNPNKCPPVIENSEQDLRDICYAKAHEIYGEHLPEPVYARLERELNSIISNGYSVMYIIAQKLVWKSNEDGYLVGSRGSVGSSFVATMSGITEVNPLSPHYYCSSCHYHDFDSEDVRAYAGGCGFDMPDKVCPECGAWLTKAGFDIPFETFLGFKGDKEPDIDLNFSGDYQAKAHKYTETIFGEGHTFKAGTIGTLADKTAYGYVKNYYEERGMPKRKCEVERVSSGCTGIRRSTGQHPGGIVVLPHGHDINEFTPVQHPANDMSSDIITTHFDYHSIDHNLLKLDILGHDDPTMIRTLEEYITSDAMENEYNEEHPFLATQIPLDDKKVLSLFHDTSALGIKPEDIDGCKLGCLGIPEFGTDFVIQMVQDAKPQSLSDLIRISGLSHGTNVWLGNAQELVKSGKATISTCICTRDDIMVYLINQGVDSALSFTIMESVRKGKGLKEEWEVAMKEKDVPDWYIWSCKQISYMFPKAHAAAYVMMAYRIAYCKINYPLAYYGAYFGIRANAFSYEIMCQGKEKLQYYIKDYKKRIDSLTNKEQDVMKDMKIVQEMYARGFEFMPIDLYRAKAHQFQIIDGKLMPSFSSIEGLGEKAAEAVEEAGKEGPYLSLDDFRQRTKVSKTVVDLMAELGLFGNLPQSNQLSLFEMM